MSPLTSLVGPIAPDYMAKDYESVRAMLLERLETTLPQWRERHAADIGLVLIEALSFAADLLSYRQDAIAMEAYLDTSVSRISVRRHARLLGHRCHDGVNARTVVAFEVRDPAVYIPAGTRLLTNQPGWLPAVIPSPELERLGDLGSNPSFETMYPVWLFDAGNRIAILSLNATSAVFKGHIPRPGGSLLVFTRESMHTNDSPSHHLDRTKSSVGQEIFAVIVSDVFFGFDGHLQPVTEVRWSVPDTLRPTGTVSSASWFAPEKWSATSNAVLADHGVTHTVGRNLTRTPGQPWRLALDGGIDMTSIEPRNGRASISKQLNQDPSYAVPAICIQIDGHHWFPVRDLVGVGPDDRCFVVENEATTSWIRFGDGVHGRLPVEDNRQQVRTEYPVTVHYRLGNGPVGNLPAGALQHAIIDTVGVEGIAKITNVVPAVGGIAAETIRAVKQFAPDAFERQIGSCVTPSDYESVLTGLRGLGDCSVVIRPVGLRSVVTVTVQPSFGITMEELTLAIEAALRPRRPIGYEIRVHPIEYVDVTVTITVELSADASSTAVRKRLATRFSCVRGGGGLFDPDSLRLGVGLRATEIMVAALGVSGVAAADVDLRCGGRMNSLVMVRSNEVLRLVNADGAWANAEVTIDIRSEPM